MDQKTNSAMKEDKCIYYYYFFVYGCMRMKIKMSLQSYVDEFFVGSVVDDFPPLMVFKTVGSSLEKQKICQNSRLGFER